MKPGLPDLDRFERIVFKRRNALKRLLAFSLDLMQARQAGLLYGTNRTRLQYLPPEKWDRGVMHRFDGKGVSGFFLKCFGTWIVRYKGLSPVRLYKTNQFGDREDSDGVIPFVLRKHQEFYEKGVKILLIDNIQVPQKDDGLHTSISMLSYNGQVFEQLRDLTINTAIVRQFKAKNFISAYIPDYGAIVFNTVDAALLERSGQGFVHDAALKKRLDMLISAIEMASLAHIGYARGRQAAHIIWRKEKNLRKTALQLKHREKELESQKRYLMAVGAVNEAQLNMEAVNIADGVYAFMDMVGSATIRNQFHPRDYFYILNLCHQIAADNATLYTCRVDNFIGDGVFLQNASPFDHDRQSPLAMGADERIMLMVLTISSTIQEIDQLKNGIHPMDPGGRVQKLISDARIDIGFRAGMEIGSSMIGPLGSQKRRIVTAIGKAVNTASRLESTGVKDWIHVSDRIITRLKNACITKDTRILYSAVRSKDPETRMNDSGILSFFEYYQQQLRSHAPMIVQRKNVSYKEFSKDISYLIRCLPDGEAS